MSERKLTDDEKRRLAIFEENARKLEEEGYKQTHLTLDPLKVNIIAIFVSIASLVLGILLFFFIHGAEKIKGNIFVVLFITIILIVVHELIHGITWSVFAKNHFKDIAFGINVSQLMPYCSCMSGLNKKQYITGAIMPFIILGLIPTIIAYLIGSYPLLLIGIIMSVSAMGDLMIIGKILSYKTDAKDVIYMDHPTDVGGVIFER